MDSFEEKLIELVRNYPEMYDSRNPHYMKTKFKQDIWRKIAKELNLKKGDEAKSIWGKLRNNHRDALRRQRRLRRSGVAAADIKRWRFQAQMEFLLRYMVNENRDTYFEDNDDHSESPSEEDQDVKYVTQRFDVVPIHAVNAVDSAISNTDYVEENHTFNSSAKNERTESPEPPTPQPKKKMKKTDIENLIIKTIEQRDQRSKERREERQKLEDRTASSDDMYLFFLSMYKQTKKMPPASQHIVKRNIFLSVSEEEARLLNIDEPSAPIYPQFHTEVAKRENFCDPNTDNWSYTRMSSPASTYSSE